MKRLFNIITIGFLLSMTPHAVMAGGVDCEKQKPEAKYNCYLDVLLQKINNQAGHDLMAMAESNGPVVSHSIIGGLSINIKLNRNGSVKELDLTKSSGDALFDSALMRSIHNASPFILPEDEKLKDELLDFDFSLMI